jgi:hypothetical protein
MVYGLYVLSSVTKRLVATVVGKIASADLAPALERRDHTISSSATASLVRVTVTAHRSSDPLRNPITPDAARVHRIPRPTFVTIAKRPSWKSTGRK